MNDCTFIATDFSRDATRVTEFEGWINVGELARPGNKWRIQVHSDQWHDWSLVELWVFDQAMQIHLDTFVLPLDATRCPPKDAARDAFVAFDKALAKKLERPVIEHLLAYREPVKTPVPPLPLAKRLVRAVIDWAREG